MKNAWLWILLAVGAFLILSKKKPAASVAPTNTGNTGLLGSLGSLGTAIGTLIPGGVGTLFPSGGLANSGNTSPVQAPPPPNTVVNPGTDNSDGSGWEDQG